MSVCKKCGKEFLSEQHDKLCPLCKKQTAENLKKGFTISAFVIFGIGLVYGISPIDFIPDTIPGLGWTDDAVVGTLSGVGTLATAIVAIVNGVKAKQ